MWFWLIHLVHLLPNGMYDTALLGPLLLGEGAKLVIYQMVKEAGNPTLWGAAMFPLCYTRGLSAIC